MVELACGTALPSLAALANGARVTSTDISILSLRLAEQSAEFQSGDFETRVFDIINERSETLLDLEPDIVVASDLLYSEVVAEALGRQLGVAAARGISVITTDAQRMAGRGQKIFLQSFQRSLGQEVTTEFVKEEIPEEILDLGVNAMKYGGQVDKCVGIFEYQLKEKERGKSDLPPNKVGRSGGRQGTMSPAQRTDLVARRR